MSGFYKLLNIVLAMVVFFLLYQSFETRDRIDQIASQPPEASSGSTEAGSV